MKNIDTILQSAFAEALTAVQPAVCLPKHISIHNNDLQIHNEVYRKSEVETVHLWAVGKAAPDMYNAVATMLTGWNVQGICIYKQGLAPHFQAPGLWIDAGHPVPNENSLKAAQCIAQKTTEVSEKDLVILLISGGASALLADLPAGVSLAAFGQLTDLLVRSGASIQEINAIRSSIGTLKGGKLAQRLVGKRAHALLVSDVPGDDAAVIGSGLTKAKRSFSTGNALRSIGDSIDGIDASIYETILAAQEAIESDAEIKSTIIATNDHALQASALYLNKAGIDTQIFSGFLNGWQEAVLNKIIALIPSESVHKPMAYLFGGETQLAVSGQGRGGRNMHLALQFLDSMQNHTSTQNRWCFLAAGTDGNDGNTDAAGAFVLSDSLAGHGAMKDALQRFDSCSFFETNGGLVKTGPTGTNVMDVAMLLVYTN